MLNAILDGTDDDRAAMVRLAERRLEAIERERAALVTLRDLYSRATPRSETSDGTTRHSDTSHVRQVRSAGGLPDMSKPGGPTETIFAIVRDTPGIKASELIDRAIAIVNTTASNKRRTIATTALDLAKKGRLRKQAGRYYPMQGNDNGLAPGGH